MEEKAHMVHSKCLRTNINEACYRKSERKIGGVISVAVTDFHQKFCILKKERKIRIHARNQRTRPNYSTPNRKGDTQQHRHTCQEMRANNLHSKGLGEFDVDETFLQISWYFYFTTQFTTPSQPIQLSQ